MEVQTPLIPTSEAANGAIGAEAALSIADEHIIIKVGDLLGAEAPRLTPGGRWVMTITLSNAIQGTPSEVGTIAVDAARGEVYFCEEERARVKARARELARAALL